MKLSVGAALEADQGDAEVLHLEAVRLLVVQRVGAEVARGGGGDGQGQGVVQGVEGHIQGVAADVRQSPRPGQIAPDEGAPRHPPPAPPAGLDVVDLAQLAGLHDPLDHLHVGVVAGLEADAEDAPGAPRRAGHVDGLVEGHRHRLLHQHVLARLEGVDAGAVVGDVGGADADRSGVPLQQAVVVLVGLGPAQPVRLDERGRFPGHDVADGDHLDVRHVLVRPGVRAGDAPAADDPDSHRACHRTCHVAPQRGGLAPTGGGPLRAAPFGHTIQSVVGWTPRRRR